MKIQMSIIFVFAMCISLAAVADPGWYSVRIDNDALAFPSSDENYTMGVVVSYEELRKLHHESNFLYIFQDYINRFSMRDRDYLDVYDNEAEQRVVDYIHDDAFTPKCLHSASICRQQGNPIERDNPYANNIWIGTQISAEDKTDKQDSEKHYSVMTEFDIGIYGTNVGHYVQTKIHEKCCKHKIPQEWDTQIGDGGSLTFLYKQIHSQYLLNEDLLRVRFKYGYWAGWNTWPTVGVVFSSKAPLLEKIRLEYDASYVLHNETLQGAWYGHNTITYNYSELEHVVGLMHLNVELFKSSGFAINYSQNWKTKELKVCDCEDKHRWGGIEFAWKY